MIFLFCLILFCTYTGLYPDEGFYADEFESVTLRELPQSAKFIDKHATYPDFHGDYSSYSKIKLSKQDYSKLLSILINDNGITENTDNSFPDNAYFIEYLDSDKVIDKSFVRQIDDNEFADLYIGFCIDMETIIIKVNQS